jgi:phenylacetate-CoA ligase
MTTVARLRFMLDNAATVVCCTPTYALRMAEVARQESIDLAGSAVRKLIVAGEPGGHVPATRQRIESAWGARLFDHTGMTEVGPLGFECESAPDDVHLMENQCIVEVVDPNTGRAAAEGETGELVLTNLGRWGSPVIRYRTGDQVRLARGLCACGRWFARMRGGILGRMDDMFVVRGNNVFPTALEAILRTFDDVAEYSVEVHQNGSLARVKLIVEPAPAADPVRLAERVGRAIHDALSFRAEVTTVPPGTLPRFEMKARRFVIRK